MSKKQIYKTVLKESETLLVEKKSKFISNVKPVDNEADAIAYVNEIKSKYPDARHNVYAYVIDENNIFRYTDDGEPSGTAGMPVLDTVRKSGLVDVVVVVTRYFGGTLLGTGGLVRAYSGSAKQGLEASKIITRMMCDIISARVSYDLVGKLQYTLARRLRYRGHRLCKRGHIFYHITKGRYGAAHGKAYGHHRRPGGACCRGFKVY